MMIDLSDIFDGGFLVFFTVLLYVAMFIIHVVMGILMALVTVWVCSLLGLGLDDKLLMTIIIGGSVAIGIGMLSGRDD